MKILGSGAALGIAFSLLWLVFGECAASARRVREGVREGPGITSLLMRAVISDLVFGEGAGSARRVLDGVLRGGYFAIRVP